MRATTARSKRDLWLRIHRYHFDDLVPAHLMDHVVAAFSGSDPSSKAFASKLGRKLGWSPAFAIRAINEYKRFVYLGIIGDFFVTPPKMIDRVWQYCGSAQASRLGIGRHLRQKFAENFIRTEYPLRRSCLSWLNPFRPRARRRGVYQVIGIFTLGGN